MATTLLGIDVNKNQGDVDFAKLHGAGFRFCICKATEGADYQDSRFATNLQRIRDLGAGSGFYPGAYHFARPDDRAGRSGGETEAKWFCKVLGEVAKSLGLSLEHDFLEPVLDMETYDQSDPNDNVAWVEGFLAVLRSETGRTGMIYTGPNYWRYQTGDSDRFVDVPLWAVKYVKDGNDPAQQPPRMPSDTRKPQWPASLWQWSGGGDYAYYVQQHGKIPGIPSGVADVDRVMGDESLLARLAAARPSVPVQPPVVDMSASFSTIDIATRAGKVSTTIARVQGLLLSQGYGPSGLTGRDGRPDGVLGDATTSAFRQFKRSVGLPADTILDAQTLWLLVHWNLD